MSLEEELKAALVTELKLDDVRPEALADDAPLFGGGLGLDSLDAVELVVILQKRYGIVVKDMEEGRTAFATIATLADFIRRRRKGE